MVKDVRIVVANPAGNITIFVLDEFSREQYQSVATQLLAMEEFQAEQVAFITGDGKMEMCGLEFCGNASRSFGLITALYRGFKGYCQIDVDVSGSDEILTVDVDTTTSYTHIKMPMPLSITTLENTPIEMINGSKLVDLGGIIHVVLADVEASRENFDVIKEYINEKYNPAAMGVMFYDTKNGSLIPVVYVQDVDTTYFEGSCGSGATAVAIAFADEEDNGTFKFTLPQPAGTITSTVEKTNGKLDAVYIEGPVTLSQTINVKIDC